MEKGFSGLASDLPIINYIVENLSKIPGVDQFVLIGEKVTEVFGLEHFYNVHVRHVSSSHDNLNFDIVLNEITKCRQIQKIESKYKTFLLAKIAHEFKNPLICITELVEELSASQTEENRIIIQIKSLSNFLLLLVEDINTFTENQMGKETSLELKWINLNELLAFCKDVTTGLMRKLKKPAVGIYFEKENNLEKLLTDEVKIKQILLNLLSNAVKFTHQGQISVNVKSEVKENRKYVVFIVKDTGIGMNQDKLKILFEPFTFQNLSQKEMASGLGMFIIKENVKKLVGELTFQSREQNGSSFTFSIPDEKESSQINKSSDSLYSQNEKDSQTTQKYNFVSGNFNLKSLYLPSEERCLRPTNSLSNFYYKNDSNSPKFSRNRLSSLEETKQKFIHILNFQSINDYISSDIFVNDKKLNSPSHNQIQFLVLIVDDEKLIRDSTVRLLDKVAQNLKISLTIIQAEDGVECLYLVYKLLNKAKKIDLILSDECMSFINGSESFSRLNEFSDNNGLINCPFYIVSAFQKDYVIKQIHKNLNSLNYVVKPLKYDKCLEIIRREIFKI